MRKITIRRQHWTPDSQFTWELAEIGASIDRIKLIEPRGRSVPEEARQQYALSERIAYHGRAAIYTSVAAGAQYHGLYHSAATAHAAPQNLGAVHSLIGKSPANHHQSLSALKEKEKRKIVKKVKQEMFKFLQTVFSIRSQIPNFQTNKQKGKEENSNNLLKNKEAVVFPIHKNVKLYKD
ncbi:hypothetical protein WN51_06356 [Melipona quadrifasciata]|uniref:Uncharacterized protein n=1 Tax=Melipona quadrifasciata TaxID=166423 RepID=A0A0M8ZSZ3_9HYME|nr:hypothetical protein WN51_06356 [Melipona quadrifasciata]